MSAIQFGQTVAAEQAWREDEARDIERGNEALAEMRPDDEFRLALEDKFPMLRAWPGKDAK